MIVDLRKTSLSEYEKESLKEHEDDARSYAERSLSRHLKRVESLWRCKMAGALLDAAGYEWELRGGWDAFRVVVDLGVQPCTRPRKPRLAYDLRTNRLWSEVLRYEGQGKDRGLVEKGMEPLGEYELKAHPELKNYVRLTCAVLGWEGVVEVIRTVYLGSNRPATPGGKKCRVVEKWEKVRTIECEV